jgi:two-component system nitrate/nitrite response regulator NarL
MGNDGLLPFAWAWPVQPFSAKRLMFPDRILKQPLPFVKFLCRSHFMGTTNLQAIRVLLIDDHALVRACLRMLIESHPGLRVVGEAAVPPDALAAAVQEHPDIILLDLDLGETNGLDLIPSLRSAVPEAHVVVLTGVRDPALHREAVRLGAVGIVLKEKAADVLFQAIAKVHGGGIWLDSVLVAGVLGEMTRLGGSPTTDPETTKISSLTAREREVIDLIGQGLKNQVIADRLCISEATVRHHLTSIFAKLSVVDRLELVVYAYRHGLACFMPHRCPAQSVHVVSYHPNASPAEPLVLRQTPPGLSRKHPKQIGGNA